ncbi:MAG TPA: DUF456 domain-containing protein [Anaerolineae bacterium]|nr:DUF456 domain-containing protein [Anaerolineae bacterium]
MVELFSGTLFAVILTVMIISLILMLVIPVLPGQFIIWGAALVYGLLTGFEELSLGTFIGISLLAIIASVVDAAAGWFGAKQGGASNKAIAAGCVLGAAGFIIFNAFGALLGVLLGLVGYEYLQDKNWQRSLKAGGGYLLGQVLALAGRFVFAVIMVGVFVTAVR